MRFTPNLRYITEVDPEKESLLRFARMLQQTHQNDAFVINGHIAFGNGVLPDNIDGVWVTTTSPGVANTDQTLTHNLGRIPVGYIVVKKSAACDVYDGTLAATATQITLKFTTAGTDVKIFVI